jgi:hypothetical protein
VSVSLRAAAELDPELPTANEIESLSRFVRKVNPHPRACVFWGAAVFLSHRPFFPHPRTRLSRNPVFKNYSLESVSIQII